VSDDHTMADGRRYAFIVSRFPQLTETFILREMTGLEDRGLDFELYALIRQGAEHLQPDAVELDRRANYLGWRSSEAIAAQWHWLRRDPLRWARALWHAVRASSGTKDALVRVPVVWMLAGAMARRMQRQGVERVHAHWITYPTLAAMVINELAGIPFSITAHAGDIFGGTGMAPRVAAADLVITCTADGRRELLAQAGDRFADKIRIIYHGSDLSRFALEPLPARGTALRILCVASLLDYKGQRYLIDACRILRDRGVVLELVLIGEGALRDELEAQTARLGVGDTVHFMGRQPHQVVKAQLDACDVFVAPSIEGAKGQMDGIPNVLVEAMAVGRPVVATARAGIRELVVDGTTGLLTGERDPVSIADAIERLANDPALCERLVAAGRAKVEAEHDSSQNLELLFDVLIGLETVDGPTAG
jgi:colanic acid/amylovoran biosynthesis glycosyltransferase